MDTMNEYVSSSLASEFSRRAKPETQQVAWYNKDYYSIHNLKIGSSGENVFQGWVNLLTPYAGDGYGMVCFPRISQKVISLPLGGRFESPVALGRVFQLNERPPAHDPGDFLIHHETHSQLLFKYFQPRFDTSWNGTDGELLKLTTVRGDTGQRAFTVEFKDNKYAQNAPFLKLKEGDRIRIELSQEKFLEQKASKGKTEQDKAVTQLQAMHMPKATRWDATITIGAAGPTAVISAANLSFGLTLPDYMADNLTDQFFKAIRLAPMKGTAELTHYTGSRLFMDEDASFVDYRSKKYLGDDLSVIQPNVVPYNISAAVGPYVSHFDEIEKKEIELSSHFPKGKLLLEHYTKSGLAIAEKENQILGHAVRIELNLNKCKPIIHPDNESVAEMLPNAQLVMEDITQDRRDVATQAFFRQMSSATISDQAFSRKKYGDTPVLMFQAEKGHYGIDDARLQEVVLDGSGWFIQDYLKAYVEQSKGWRFATVKEARAQYNEFNERYFEAVRAGQETYEIDYKTRIIPASARRDVMLKREKDEGEAADKFLDSDPKHTRLMNFSRKTKEKEAQGVVTITEETKEFVGQRGYTFKAYEDNYQPLPFQDGYLCNPKGEISFRHYTRSGIVIRELEPDIDYHGIYAAFSLYNWDLGQYHPNHTFSSRRDARGMKFGPYPLPVAQLVMESAKFECEPVTKGEAAIAAMPTVSVKHTAHPKPAFGEKNDSERTTLATYGETGTWMGLFHRSSHVQKIERPAPATGLGDVDENIEGQPEADAKFFENRFGNRLLFKDYVIHASPKNEEAAKKKPLISAAKWKNTRGGDRILIAPKGSLELQHYTSSGLAIYDQRLHYLNEHGGGHAMAMRLSLRSFDFSAQQDAQPVPLFKNDDGAFFCEILSNERVDDQEYEYTIEDGEDGAPAKTIKENGSSRGKKATKPHGKRAAKTGFSHGTTAIDGNEQSCVLFFEDYILPVEKEGKDYNTEVIHAGHIYKKPEQDEVKPRKLLMPKGRGIFQLYNNSGIEMGDSEKGIEERQGNPDEIKDAGKKQKVYARWLLNEWNNQKIEDAEALAPYEDPSAEISMSCLANVANYEGKDATRILIHALSSKAKNVDMGTSLIFEDFVKEASDDDSGVTSAHAYDDGGGDGTRRLDLLFPKGQLALQLYNKSGLIIQEREKESREKQSIFLKLAMREWKNQGTDACPFDEDSCSLTMESVSPAATKDGKRASKISLEGLTSKAASASFGNCLVLEDYVGADGEPSHIYDGGAGSLKFPKGAVSLMHYTGTGLYMSEQAATGEDKHSPCLVLRLRRWDETSPQQDDIAKFFAETLTVNKEEESARVGFAHVATSSACFIQDSNPSPDEHQIINGITHWGREIGPDNEASFLQFEDLLPTGKAEQVMIRLHHKQSSELRFEQLTKEKAEMLVSLSHKNESKLVMEDFPGKGTAEFPKGAVSLMHYTGTGLYMSEQAAAGLDKHSPCLVLRLRRWGETGPESDDVAKFFAETLSVQKEEEASRIGFAHVATSSACFIQDSNLSPDEHQIVTGITHWGREIGPDNEASFLQFEDLLPTGKAEQVMIRLHHKQSSELRFEQLTKEKAEMLVSLSHKNESKLVMEDFPGKGTAEFPKGALILKHYTNSGLYITETEMLPENHKPKVQLKLKSWEKRDDEDPISQFYAEVTSKEKEKESSIIGFDHAATGCSFWIADVNEKKDEHKITCGIRHYDSSFLRFEDMTDNNNEQVDIILKHKKDCWLSFKQQNVNPGDMTVDLHHSKNAGLKIESTNNDTTINIYHPTGALVRFDKDGTITAYSPKKLIGESPDIELRGKVKISGNLEVTGTISAPNGSWHSPVV